VNESGLTLDSRVLYLVLFDIFVFKILNKNKSHFWTDLLLWEKINREVGTKNCLKNQNYVIRKKWINLRVNEYQ
jgi:hypothetical protein